MYVTKPVCRRDPRTHQLRCQTASAVAMAGPVTDLVHSELVTTGSAVALAYHGYKRTGSVLWALLYAYAGKKVPVLAVPIAVAQGYGVRKGCP